MRHGAESQTMLDVAERCLRTLSVIVHGFTRPDPPVHGHMADRA